jgi:Secretion system C-terminal sorting domain
MKSTQVWLLIAFITVSIQYTNAQTTSNNQVVKFSYDEHGNRTKREVTITLQSKVKKKQQDIEPTEDQMGERTIKIFPNPTRGDLNIDVTNLNPKEELRMELYNINGTQLYNARVQEGSNPLDMNTYPSTVYILRLVSGSEKMEYKIIKE